MELGKYIEAIENALGKKAKRNLLPLQLGDVPDTYADVQALVDEVAYKPDTTIEEGIGRFVEWYLGYFND